MLLNIAPAATLKSLARVRGKESDFKSVKLRDKEDAIVDGWTVVREGDTSVRVSRRKRHDILWEHRVWMLFYRLGFKYLSAEGGATLILNPKDDDSPRTQIDVVAIDNEVAISVECKSAKTYSKRADFHEELGKHGATREHITKSANNAYRDQDSERLRTVLAMFVENAQLSEKDLERAEQAGICIFTEEDLAYYEKLSQHLGSAAKYQLLADMLPGKTIPRLKIRVPAVKAKMGGAHCYTFPIAPEYLLKIGYVSHRSKGKASDVQTYQRMLQKARLTKIRDYIKKDGIFPTNIVINFEPNRLHFERVQQKASKDDSTQSGILGWLDISPAYKSAWVIDGQHRLYAYSGQERAGNGVLSVLAFDGLPASQQAALFIDINSKQKSVKQSLLQELYAELHWDAADPRIRVRAILSKCIQVLNGEKDSALASRVQMADDTKDERRCISLTSLYSSLERTEFLISKEKKGQVVEFGPFWDGDNAATLRRTVDILKWWFGQVRDAVPEWWDKGSGEGGGLSMNDGITACTNVLRSILTHLSRQHGSLTGTSVKQLTTYLQPFADALANHLKSLSDEDRRRFRDLRGIQGQNTRTRRFEKSIREAIPSFNPDGLDRFIEMEKSQTNAKAKEATDRIELALKKLILEELRDEFGNEESDWWTLGVPKNVRLAVSKLQEEDDNKRGGKEFYFTLIHYREIVTANWQLFEKFVAYGPSGNKQKKTEWMVFINEKRNLVAHPTASVMIPMEELTLIEQYDQWLQERIRTGSESQEDTPAGESGAEEENAE
jgi:DNA sulfur modification protein DndB